MREQKLLCRVTIYRQIWSYGPLSVQILKLTTNYPFRFAFCNAARLSYAKASASAFLSKINYVANPKTSTKSALANTSDEIL